MNRNIIFIIVLLFISGVYLYGKSYKGKTIEEKMIIQDTTLLDWKERTADSCGIPLPAMNIAINGYYALKSKDLLNKTYNISMQKPLGFNNTYTLTVSKDFAEKYKLETISDLVKLIKKNKK